MRSWTELVIRGSEEQITRFLARIDARLRNGWRRDFAAESRMKERLPWYVGRSYSCTNMPNRPAAFVLLSQCGPNEITAPQVGPLELGQWTDENREQALSAFAADCVRPVADECGLQAEMLVRAPSVKDGLSRGAWATLQAFSDAASKQDATDADTQRWKAFLLRVYLDQSVIDRDLFELWLGQQGWPVEQRTRLIAELNLALELLAAYDEECRR